ncbi:hypothetical protein E5676_scaffold86G00200 [Cucumis melo var. makuwa]|uniref:Uncharacterized protein n=1 Tax=Cucumis melo var. makuwa TaxID=1194695 RepID=A0A5D3DVS5_CUCMM|nr:hypothetical protein E6C27_scaffold338G00180 [Cucumis melo var. makuwa]TYK27602.1 hypothetical protein E5676_scaffold86G00200 [Cucumis melo var. makuwa]
MVEGKKVDFGSDAMNKVFGLKANEIEHAIFKNSQEQDLEDAFKSVAWLKTKWHITPIGKYQLFTYNLSTKKTSCEMISKHIIAWVKHPRGGRPFPRLIKKLCLKACLTLEQLPQLEQDGKPEVENVVGEAEDGKKEEEVPLKQEIPLPLFANPTSQNKVLSPKDSNQDVFQDSISDPTVFIDDAFNEKQEGARSSMLSPKERELQRRKLMIHSKGKKK